MAVEKKCTEWGLQLNIGRGKSLLKIDELEGMQYETLAMAIHLYELNKNRYKFEIL